MEQSAFEAVMIGVNVFVFIIALTAAILLMTNILDMVEFANQNVVSGMNGAIGEVVGNVQERIYTGNQMLAYYRNILDDNESDFDFKIKLSETGQERVLKDYIQSEVIKNYINKEFELRYKGVINNKETYVFVLK